MPERQSTSTGGMSTTGAIETNKSFLTADQDVEMTFAAMGWGEYDIFMINSGSTCHITNLLEGMENVKQISKEALVGDHKKLKAMHRGELILLTDKRVALRLLGVLFIKNFAKNIVSIKPLVDSGLAVQGTAKSLIFKKKGFSLVTSQEADLGFYVFKARRCSSWEDAKKLAAESRDQVNIMTAHGIFGHMGETELRSTFAAKQIKLVGKFHCNACCAMKARQKPTRKLGQEVIMVANKLLYINTSGPFKLTGGSNKYWVMVVDAATGRVFLMLLPTKSGLED